MELTTGRRTQPDELSWTLSLVVSQREGLVRELTRVKNRLHALLPYAHPAYREFFADSFGKTALAFWHRYPSSGARQSVCVDELTAFLQAESHWAFGR